MATGTQQVGTTAPNGIGQRSTGIWAVDDAGLAVGVVGDFPGFGIDTWVEASMEFLSETGAAPNVLLVHGLQ